MIELEGSPANSEILRLYDSRADRWLFPREGPFWAAVLSAHAHGRFGEGRRVAVIDASFDLSVPRLRHQSGGAPRQSSLRNEPTAHGTAAALLVSVVAPRCTLDLYETSRHGEVDRDLVLRALDATTASDAKVVTLSLGESTELTLDEMSRLVVRADHCTLCAAASKAAVRGKAVIAAVGNYPDRILCPARCENVIGVGFGLERRELKRTAGGGFAEVAFVEKPSYPQSPGLRAFILRQPAGVAWSSFATPLVAGLVALMDDPLEACGFIAAGPDAGDAQLLHARLPENWPAAKVRTVAKLYRQALARLPHRHDGSERGEPCVGCAVFCESLYTNAGLFFLQSRQLADAEPLLRAAHWFAPWSPHAAANLGRVLEVRGEQTVIENPQRARALLLEARDIYRQALELRPEFQEYGTELHKIDVAIEGLPRGLED